MEPNFVPGYFKNTTEETKMSNYLKSTRNTTPWPIVELGLVIEQRKEFITIDDFGNYKRCRVQLHAKGIVLRDVVQGYAIKTKTQQVCRAGEFLVAEIDAKVGGFGIVPPDLEGAIVSSHYFLFAIDEARLDRQFLDYYLRTHVFQDQVTARGSTNYAAIRPQHVLGYTIPLPPLDEQRRIVARIEALAAKVEAARELREEVRVATEKVITASLDFLDIFNYPMTKPLRHVVREISEKTTGIESPNELYLSLADVESNTGRILREQTAAEAKIQGTASRFKRGMVLYGKLRPYLNKVIEAPFDGICTTEFVVLDPNENNLLPQFLVWYLRSPVVVNKLVKNSSGTKMPRTNMKVFHHLNVPIPPLPEQRRIVAHLDALQAQLIAVHQHQAATQARLDALMPSILDRAFRGEL